MFGLHNFLTFSDAAKYADIARNLIFGLGYGNSFTFWNNSLFNLSGYNVFSTFSVPPVMPFSIAAIFKIFGVSDLSVIATSVFYFILSLIFVFLLAKKVFDSKLCGALSTLAIAFNKDMIDYAFQGGSESPFIFEIVATGYFISLRKKWANVISLILLVLMYFTRPQAFIYIAGLILFWQLTNFKIKKALVGFVGVIILGLIVDYFVLMPFSGKYFLYSILGRGLGSSFNQTSVASDALRGGSEVVATGQLQMLKNVFYNLYNFFKLMPQIMSPYLFGLFVISLFVWGKDKLLNSFKSSTIFMFLLTFLVAAVSIPFFRYLHPVVPLVYIVAVGMLVNVLELGFKNYDLGRYKKVFLVLSSLFVVLVFGVGQTLGELLLDSRFEAKTHNVGKPPVYVELSKVLKENTKPTDIIITNLDTWGSWYGERKTVWFPMEPKQIIDSSTGKIPFDAIYLTNYKIDDSNYRMGDGWRTIFDNPENPKNWTCDKCEEFTKKFALKEQFTINRDNVYEAEDYKAVLLIRK